MGRHRNPTRVLDALWNAVRECPKQTVGEIISLSVQAVNPTPTAGSIDLSALEDDVLAECIERYAIEQSRR